MNIDLLSILKILGSLALFIYGMKVMSEGIQRAAGSQMRAILQRMTSNRFIGLFSGFLITALVQSSSATTVMTVSFVNAGLISLIESAGIMMGANIGTTITGWLITFGIGKFSFADYALPIFAFGLPLIFMRRGKWNYWGECLIGFALLFLGLSFLKSSFPDFNSHPEALQFLANFPQTGILSTLLFVGIGALITAAIQSSSAAMALTIVMLAKGWIPLEIAIAMTLGENIGTTITAEIAALVGNVHAKRSARIHSLFNLIGVFWMILLLPWFIPFIKNLSESFLRDTIASSEVTTIAAFHTTFNLLNALLLIAFVPWLIKLAKRTIRSRGKRDENFRLSYINALLKTPELSIVEVQRELTKYGEVTSKMCDFTRQLLFSTDEKEQEELLKRIAKYENITDKVEVELSRYLDKVATFEVSTGIAIRIRGMLSICNDLERIGDIFYQMSKTIERKVEEKIWFNQTQRQSLQDIFDLLEKSFRIMNENLSNPEYNKVNIQKAVINEAAINALRDQLRQDNLSQQQSEDYNEKSTLIYTNLFSSIEKAGDHVMNVSEAITGEV